MTTHYLTISSPVDLTNVIDAVAEEVESVIGRKTVGRTADITVADFDTDGAAAVTAEAAGNKTNEVVSITVDATGGTFTATFGAQETSALAFNVSADDFEAALVALSSVGAGEINVSGGPGDAGGTTPYYLQFVNGLAGTDVGAVTTDPASLTGGAGTAAVAVIVAGGQTPSA